jgi:hypothetical protein
MPSVFNNKHAANSLQPSDCELGAGCDTWYVQPHCDEQLGVAHGVHPSSVQQALDAACSAGKRVTAVLVVSPTYFGVCSDISGSACVLACMLVLSYMFL